jgi:cytochrome b
MVRGRIWDPLVRLFHWSLAIAFAVAWFVRSESAIHETAGEIVLILIIVRAAWGLIGPASARFETFVKGPIPTAKYLWSIVRGQPRHYPGHNPAGAAMIGALLLALVTTTVSGILMTTTALWGNGWIEWLHGTAATLCVWLIGFHLLGVIVACFQHRENLPRAMIDGWKWVEHGTQSYLGAGVFTLRRIAAAAFVVAFSAAAWSGGQSLLNASYWRMDKIVAAAAAEHGCDVAGIAGPRIEIFPRIKLHYDVAVKNTDDVVPAEVPGHLALQRRPKIEPAVFAADCVEAPAEITSALLGDAPAATPGLPPAHLSEAASSPRKVRVDSSPDLEGQPKLASPTRSEPETSTSDTATPPKNVRVSALTDDPPPEASTRPRAKPVAAKRIKQVVFKKKQKRKRKRKDRRGGGKPLHTASKRDPVDGFGAEHHDDARRSDDDSDSRSGNSGRGGSDNSGSGGDD